MSIRLTAVFALLSLSHAAADKPAPASAAVELKELVGRTAPDHSERISVARFVLQPGTVLPTSYNREGEEVFVIFSGQAEIRCGDKIIPAQPGSVIRIPARVRHSIRASGSEPLDFYAITTPAFSPGDYVKVSK